MLRLAEETRQTQCGRRRALRQARPSDRRLALLTMEGNARVSHRSDCGHFHSVGTAIAKTAFLRKTTLGIHNRRLR